MLKIVLLDIENRTIRFARIVLYDIGNRTIRFSKSFQTGDMNKPTR